mgnify:FL=1|jgi:hypothetical protein
MSPYRTSAATIRPESLDQLFAAKSNLKAEDGLSVSYRLLPWKRHVCVVRYEPASIGAFLQPLASNATFRIDVLRSDEVATGRYGIDGARLIRQDAREHEFERESHDLEVLSRVTSAQVRVGGVRFGLAEGKLLFEVSGFEVDELSQRFSAAFPWQALGLPALLGREWLVLDRPM